MESWELNPSPLKEQQVLLTTERAFASLLSIHRTYVLDYTSLDARFQYVAKCV